MLENIFDKSEYTIPHFLKPSGCLDEWISKPFNDSEAIKVATFHEHRFAFYYWLDWTKELEGVVPSLVTFDWHQDLCPPYKDKIEALKALPTDNKARVAFYTWAQLEHTNDVHIQSAILLNKIKNVYVICRQTSSRENPLIIDDFKGNEHKVFIFSSIEEFENSISKLDESHIYLDIDLDYFTLCNPPSVNGRINGKRYTYLKKGEIEELFSHKRPAMKWILNRLQGLTIAMEPDFCGGLQKSNKLFNILEQTLFTQPLFNRNIMNKKQVKWKTYK